MDIQWLISGEDVAQVKVLVENQSNKGLVRARRERNLAKAKPIVTRERFWHAMVSMPTHLTPSLIEAIRSRYALEWHGIHGVSHWARVRNNGLKLAAHTGGSRQSATVARPTRIGQEETVGQHNSTVCIRTALQPSSDSE